MDISQTGVPAKVDLTNSKLVISADFNKAAQAMWKGRVNNWTTELRKDKSERQKIYRKRRDFFEGDQAKYTTIVGKTKKEKEGHANAVFNIAGKMIIKIYFALGNNPPHYTIKPLLSVDQPEAIKAQGVEDFIGRVFWTNKFWLHGYKRAVMNQSLLANFAVMVYPDFTANMIRIINLEKMENLMVGWRGDDTTSYDYTIYEEERSVYSVEKEFGIKVATVAQTTNQGGDTLAGHTDPYGTNPDSRSGSIKDPIQPSGKTDSPMCRFTDVWTDEVNVILINGELVQLVKHGFGFNPVIVGRNIHNPGKVWDISDIDYLMDPQIEYNEATNDVRDFIRAGVNQKYKAVNMPDFDPEAIKAGSGQVIYVNDDEDFVPISNNVNTFPADTHIQRVEKVMHKVGVPEVTFGTGASAGVSGRARAIDFQSFTDTIVDKQGSWEYVLSEVSERVQILGNKYFAPKTGINFFQGPDGKFEVREIVFDWTEVLPTTQSDKQVDIINKRNAGMISLQTALAEAGYADPLAEIEKIKAEWKDPQLAPVLGKQPGLMEGIIKAEIKAQMEQAQAQQDNAAAAAPPTDQNAPAFNPGQGGPAQQPNPQMTQSQNESARLPMAQPGSTIAFSSPGAAAGNVNIQPFGRVGNIGG